MTASLLQAAQSLILYTIEAKSNLKGPLNDHEQGSKEDNEKKLSELAAAAVSAAEANGALPPMSQSQRKLIKQTLCKVASSMSLDRVNATSECEKRNFPAAQPNKIPTVHLLNDLTFNSIITFTGLHHGIEAGEGEDTSMEILRGGMSGPYLAPELPELLQELSTLELFTGWGEQGGCKALLLEALF
jgi:hypothetical protein